MRSVLAVSGASDDADYVVGMPTNSCRRLHVVRRLHDLRQHGGEVPGKSRVKFERQIVVDLPSKLPSLLLQPPVKSIAKIDVLGRYSESQQSGWRRHGPRGWQYHGRDCERHAVRTGRHRGSRHRLRSCVTDKRRRSDGSTGCRRNRRRRREDLPTITGRRRNVGLVEINGSPRKRRYAGQRGRCEDMRNSGRVTMEVHDSKWLHDDQFAARERRR